MGLRVLLLLPACEANNSWTKLLILLAATHLSREIVFYTFNKHSVQIGSKSDWKMNTIVTLSCHKVS